MVAPKYPKPRRRLVGQSLLYAISMFASLGVFLFGYDQGVMSGIITGPHFIRFFGGLDAIQVGTIVAVLEIGAFATSVAAGRVGDMIGRKGTLFIGAVVFTVGGVLQTFTVGFWSMIFGRVISGFGVGLLSTIVPIYQSEISPPNHRGALACAEFTGNIFGYAFSVWTDYFCSFIDSDLSWRIPLFLQCIIGAILALGSLVMPESPRWLIDASRDDAGLRVLVDLHGGDITDDQAQLEFQEIKEKVLQERESGGERTYGTMWRRYKQRVLLAMSSQAFAQLNGINVISYYAPRVFEEAGWIGRDAILMTGINAIVYTLSTLPPWYLVDRWGRRPILLSGALVMSLALFSTGYWIYLNKSWTPDAVVASVIIFNAAFGYSWGPIPWLYPPEILPLSVRAKGVSLSTATNWAFNWIVVLFLFISVFYPETKGVPLEEMDAVFGEELNHSTFIEPFREHLPLGSSLEMSPVLAQCVYPPRPHTSSGRIGTNRSGEENSSWLSQMMGRKSRSKSGKNGEGSSYKLLSRGEDGDEDEMHRFRTDVDTHVIGDNEDTEGSEELEVVHARRSNSGGLHRSR
ncbi:hypothetical protein Ac2012v2_005973 [Leucoagaricus gongylophorus]